MNKIIQSLLMTISLAFFLCSNLVYAQSKIDFNQSLVEQNILILPQVRISYDSDKNIKLKGSIGLTMGITENWDLTLGPTFGISAEENNPSEVIATGSEGPDMKVPWRLGLNMVLSETKQVMRDQKNKMWIESRLDNLENAIKACEIQCQDEKKENRCEQYINYRKITSRKLPSNSLNKNEMAELVLNVMPHNLCVDGLDELNSAKLSKIEYQELVILSCEKQCEKEKDENNCEAYSNFKDTLNIKSNYNKHITDNEIKKLTERYEEENLCTKGKEVWKKWSKGNEKFFERTAYSPASFSTAFQMGQDRFKYYGIDDTNSTKLTEVKADDNTTFELAIAGHYMFDKLSNSHKLTIEGFYSYNSLHKASEEKIAFCKSPDNYSLVVDDKEVPIERRYCEEGILGKPLEYTTSQLGFYTGYFNENAKYFRFALGPRIGFHNQGSNITGSVGPELPVYLTFAESPQSWYSGDYKGVIRVVPRYEYVFSIKDGLKSSHRFLLLVQLWATRSLFPTANEYL